MNRPIRRYTVVITEIQRQVLLDVLDIGIEQDLWTSRIEDAAASHLREGLDRLPEAATGPVNLT